MKSQNILYNLTFLTVIYFLYSPFVCAESIIEADVTILLLNEDNTPAAGLTYSGECAAKKDDSFFSDKIVTKFSCKSDSNGICKFQYKTYKLNDEIYSICIQSENPSIVQNGIKSEALIGTWGALPNRRPNVYVAISKKNGKWVSYSNGGKAERLADRLIHNNAVYYYEKDEFLKAQQNLGSLEFYIANVKIKDDDFESIATLTTENAHKNNAPRFLRAFINKKNKKVIYQVYVSETYYDLSFRNYNQAKFISLNEPQLSQVVRISSNVDCSNKVSGNCRYFESIGFELDAKTFESIVDKYKSEPNGLWKYRVSSNSGHDLNAGLAYAEFAAIFKKIEDYMSNK